MTLLANRYARRCGLAVAVVALAAALLGYRDLPAAVGDVPVRAVKVAGGRLDGQASWGIWLFGRSDHGSCWVTRVKRGDVGRDTTACGFSVPERQWQLAAQGSFGPRGHRRSLLFFLTRRRIDRLRVHVVQVRRVKTLNLVVDHLSASEAKSAGLPGNFGYASATFSGSIRCIRRIEAADYVQRGAISAGRSC